MIAFDTNLLVRFIVEDDPAQTETVVRAITRIIKSGDRIYVTQVVLSELVWVLSYTYGLARADIVTALHQLLRADHLEIQDNEAAKRALARYSEGRGDFADYLIAEIATAAGCDRILTFDAKLWSDSRFVAPGRWR